jgi:predicted TIM-barrel fold metal-dependent hydrolase
LVQVLTDRAQPDSNVTPLTIISCDGHVHPDLDDQRQYCAPAHLEAYDSFTADWHARSASIFAAMTSAGGLVNDDVEARKQACFTQPGLTDPNARYDVIDREGIAAEVLFFGGKLGGGDPQPFANHPDMALRAHGLHMYNLWLKDFCSVQPERHVGVAEIPIWDVDEAIAEMRWAREVGMMCTNLPSPVMNLHPAAFNDPIWEPFWSAAEDLDMTLNLHAGGGDRPVGLFSGPEAFAMFLGEDHLATYRAIHFLIFGGVFDRHPNLRIVLTESRVDWLPQHLKDLDSIMNSVLRPGSIKSLEMKPSEYWARHCWMAGSFLAPWEVVDVDHLMWGADYPHPEGTWPWTRDHLRYSLSTVTEAALRKILSTNPAGVFGFDLAELDRVAARIGAPTPADVAVPLEAFPEDVMSSDGVTKLTHAFRETGKHA